MPERGDYKPTHVPNGTGFSTAGGNWIQYEKSADPTFTWVVVYKNIRYLAGGRVHDLKDCETHITKYKGIL